ncbi:hypothetical protein [Gelidibacter salicanalis]|uniref:Leucine-rich repeat domain-containing protein n=1 Tax=Gelidibacter salicanalis TaxID=291193 RepID=A0A934KJX7_9FLAO|nr:hypothetical protein [Gelidibacter salicanalis]MBJ7880432.1 hypothetical protein [Gelidibacter salicanalis]
MHRFKFQNEIDGSKKLIIESSRLEDCIKYILDGNTKSITINCFQGYSLDNIDFLKEISEVIEGLHLPETKFDIEIINSLHKLRFLGFADNKKNTIDLSNFPKIEILATNYSSRLIGLETCITLNNLTLTGFNSKHDNLSELSQLIYLKELNLFKTGIKDLKGIEALSKLEKLEIFDANKLKTIASLTSLFSIKELRLQKCKNIDDLHLLGEVKSLRKLIITECGEIKSLDFIEKLENLDFLSFWDTTILDGNLNFCEGINFVGFKDKKGYSHKVSDFRK